MLINILIDWKIKWIFDKLKIYIYEIYAHIRVKLVPNYQYGSLLKW